MLRAIKKPVVYAAGPEVFNMVDSDLEFFKGLEKKYDVKVLHPGRHGPNMPLDKIYKECKNDARVADVVIADLNDFRGTDADTGTSVEIGIAAENGAIILGHKRKKEDPMKKYQQGLIRDTPVDGKGYFVEPAADKIAPDRNLMISASLDKMFYGPKKEVLEQIFDYINKNVRGWYRHEDPLIGRKLLPPNTKERHEPLVNLEVDVTRFMPILKLKEMYRHKEVKQLGALFWEYSLATHSRWSHMIMSYEYTRIALDHLNLSKFEKLHTLVYALIHDIGHTPYSHELEEIVELDQMDRAVAIIQKLHFKKALKQCGVDPNYLITFFDKNNPNPLKQIVSDKVLGSEKIAYLHQDGDATGKWGNVNPRLLLKHSVYEDGKFGIDEFGVNNAIMQMWAYHHNYVSTYFTAESKCNQRIFTLLGQIAIEEGTLPKNWFEFNDLWYDYYNIKAEEEGHKELKKLGANGIVNQSYCCAGSLRLKNAMRLENSGIYTEPITEEQYRGFLKIPVRDRRKIEDALCKKARIEPLDLIIAPGGDMDRWTINDTLVFKNSFENPQWLLKDLYPETKEDLETKTKRHAVSVRFYPRKDCRREILSQMPELMQEFRKIISSA